jgi:hypothetical protein
MPTSELAPLNLFAVELRRAAAGAAAPDKAPSLRELSKISGVGRSAIGDWLAGRSLPRSWDDGAVLVVDAIIKLAARYGKRFPDEEAVRQRCKDAYESAKNTSQVPGGAPLPGIGATADPADAASWRSADDEPGPVGPVPEAGSAAHSSSRGRGKYAAVAGFAVVTVAVLLTLLWWLPEKRALVPAADLPPIKVSLHPTPLRSAKSEKCVTVDGDADETRAFQLGCTDAPGRSWYLQQAAETGASVHLFRIVNASNGKCLSYSDEFFGGARVVVQRPCVQGKDQGQTWSFVFDPDRGDGWIYGRLANMRSSYCLDINGESVDDGTPVIQWNCGEKLNQLFKVMKEAVR